MTCAELGVPQGRARTGVVGTVEEAMQMLIRAEREGWQRLKKAQGSASPVAKANREGQADHGISVGFLSGSLVGDRKAAH